MATSPKSDRITPADDLRQLLAQCEDDLIKLADPAGAMELFRRFDQIDELLPQIQSTGADVRAEETRWQSLQERMLARAAQVVRAWQGSDRLAAARQAQNPPQSRWWWWIDQQVARRRRNRLRNAALAVLAAALLLVLANFLLSRLFPVDPAVRAAYRAQLQAEVALSGGDLAGSRQSLEQALAATPGDPALWVLHGVVANLQGDASTADQSWQQARDLLGAEAPFLTERGLAYLRAGQLDAAVDDLAAAAALEPASARTQLALGNALESVGRYQEAVTAYEQAATLADASGNAELVATARVQLATALQRMQGAPAATPQP
jgi:tetratricopeptide (TPR) repeat protein